MKTSYLQQQQKNSQIEKKILHLLTTKTNPHIYPQLQKTNYIAHFENNYNKLKPRKTFNNYKKQNKKKTIYYICNIYHQ